MQTSASAKDFQIQTDDAVYMFVNGDSGNMGVGTITPVAQLHIGVGAPTHPYAPALGASDALVKGDLEVDGAIYGNMFYSNPTYKTVQAALDFLLYVTPSVSAFSSSVTTAEEGSTVDSVTLSWTLNKSMTSLSINQGVGAQNPIPLTGSVVDNTDRTTDVTWTITAGDGTNTATRTATLDFRWKRHWGVSASYPLDNAAVLGLASNELATGRTQTRSITATGQYIYIAYPSAWGAATFTVNGFPSNDWVLDVLSHTNASGAPATNYNVYRSQNILNGTYTVVVN